MSLIMEMHNFLVASVSLCPNNLAAMFLYVLKLCSSSRPRNRASHPCRQSVKLYYPSLLSAD
jgi:hypothetical protein